MRLVVRDDDDLVYDLTRKKAALTVHGQLLREIMMRGCEDHVPGVLEKRALLPLEVLSHVLKGRTQEVT